MLLDDLESRPLLFQSRLQLTYKVRALLSQIKLCLALHSLRRRTIIAALPNVAVASDEMLYMVSHASTRHFQIDLAAMWCKFDMILGPLADA